MKKQFLLGLMAMLLPLGAWADDNIFIVELESDYTFYEGTNTNQPKVTVKAGGEMVENSNYTIAYTLNGQPAAAVKNAGTYTITVTGSQEGSYAGYTGTANYEVYKNDLTVTVGKVDKTYGTPDSEIKAVYTLSGLQPGDNKNSVSDGLSALKVARIIGYTGENVGSYQITLNDENVELDNYEIIITGTSTLNILAKPLDVSFTNLTWTYGETEAKINDVTVTATGYAEGDEFEGADDVALSWDFASTANVTKANIHNAGTYPIIARINSNNYTLQNATANIEISKANLNVTVKDLEKTYGMNDPNLADALTDSDNWGWAYDEDKGKYTVSLTREPGEDVTEDGYKINGCTISPEDNYAVVYEEGSLATLIIEAKSLSDEDIKIEVAEDGKVYQGQQDNFKLNAITVKYTGKEVESIEETLDADTEYGFSINEVKNAGETVTVTVTPLSQNYTGTATTTFEIAKAPLDITINDQEFQYDATKTAAEMLQPDEYNVGDLQSGDSRDGLGIELYPYGDAAKGSVGTYIEGIRFKATGEIAKNYEFNPTYGTLTITGDPNGITLDGSLETDEVSNTVAAYNGKEVDVTIKKLTSFVDMENSKFEPNVIIKAEKWYTLALPFDVTVRELSALFGYAIVNVPNTDNADGEVRFKLTMQTVPANTLMAFKVDKDIIWNTEKEVTFEGKTIVAPTDDYSQEKGNLDGAGNKFIATYKKQHITEATQRYIFPKDGKFYPADAMSGGVDIYPLNGYVECVSTSARIYMEEPDGSTTAVSAITGEAINNAEGWYTIGGVKLNDIPTEKGIYINNGKKVVIK